MTPSKELPLARPKNTWAKTKAVDWREFCAPFSGSSALSPLGEEMTQKAPQWGTALGSGVLSGTWDTSNRCLSLAPTPGQAWFRLVPQFAPPAVTKRRPRSQGLTAVLCTHLDLCPPFGSPCRSRVSLRPYPFAVSRSETSQDCLPT